MSDFYEACYQKLREVPTGYITTYQELALALNSRAVCAVGTAMNKNPYPREEVPCHRVVRSDGSVGGYESGTERKIERLRAEGLVIIQGKIQDFETKLWKF